MKFSRLFVKTKTLFFVPEFPVEDCITAYIVNEIRNLLVEFVRVFVNWPAEQSMMCLVESDMVTGIHPHPAPHHKSWPCRRTIQAPAISMSVWFNDCKTTSLFRPHYCQYIVKFSSSVSLSQLHTSLVESMDKQPQVIHSISTQLSYRYLGITVRNVPVPAVLPHTRYPLLRYYRIFV